MNETAPVTTPTTDRPGLRHLRDELDGSAPTNLSRSTTGEWAPTFSPDGTGIAFQAYEGGVGGDLYVMDADGSDRKRLTTGPEDDLAPDFSADGSKIVFTRTQEVVSDGVVRRVSDIWIMNADGTDPVNLTRGRGPSGDPVFSPDGSKIAFTRQPDPGLATDVFVMNVDGSGETRLTTDPEWDYARDWYGSCSAPGRRAGGRPDRGADGRPDRGAKRPVCAHPHGADRHQPAGWLLGGQFGPGRLELPD